MKYIYATFIFIVLVLSVGFASAFEFDNVKDVKKVGKYERVEITNAFGFGAKIADIDKVYNTDTCYSECYTIWNVTVHSSSGNFLNDIEFKHIEGGQKPLHHQFEYAESWEQHLSPIYKQQCGAVISGNGSRTCSQVIVGYNSEYLPVWKEFNPRRNLPVGKYLIKLKGYKEVQQTVDWVPTFYGQKVDEWAFWVGSTPKGYWKFNEASGNANDSSGNGRNLSNPYSLPYRLGKLFNSSFGYNTTTSMNNTNFPLLKTQSFTIGMWLNWSTTPSGVYVMTYPDSGGGGTQGALGFALSPIHNISVNIKNTDNVDYFTGGGGINYSDGLFHRIIVTRDNSTGTNSLKLYIDGTLISQLNLPTTVNISNSNGGATNNLVVGANAGGAQNAVNIGIDDLVIYDIVFSQTDVTTDYNGGAGRQADTLDDITIDLQSPANNANQSTVQSNFTCQALTFNNSRIYNVSLYHNATGTWHLNVTNTTIRAQNTNSSNITFSVNQMGSAIWNCQGFNTNNVTAQASSNRTLNVDSSTPLINFTAPNNTINYHLGGTNITFNWTIHDNALNLNSCRLEFNGVNHTVACYQNGTTLNTTTAYNATATFYANDTFQNVRSVTNRWNYNLFENSHTFNTETVEGTSESIFVNITYNNTKYTSISAILYYNNTANTGATQIGTSSNIVFNKTLAVPAITASTNIPFYWLIQLTNSTATVNINSTNHTQRANAISIDNCATNKYPFMNFTLLDEDGRTGLNGTIESIITLFSPDLTQNSSFSFNITGGTTGTILATCISNITNYIANYQTKYYSPTYYAEFKYGQNITINNDTLPQRINIYDLINGSVNNIEFEMFFKDINFLPVEGAIIDIQRQYIPIDQFISVETPITDDDGKAVGHFVQSSQVYTIIVSKNGLLLGTFSNVVAKCQVAPCQINLNAFSSTTSPTNFRNYGGVSYALAVDDTNREVELTYTTTDSTSKNLSLRVVKIDQFGNNTACQNSQSGSSGTIVCPVPTSFGNATYRVQVYADNTLVATSGASFSETSEEVFGGTRIFLAILLYTTLAFLFIGSPIMMLVGACLGMVFAISLNVIDGGQTFWGTGSIIMWFVIACGIIAWRIARR